MQQQTYNRLLGFSLFFLAHWFFGNLYEEIVLAPNQLMNTFQALKSWHSYFTYTNQIHYYVPFTQLAVVVLCILYFKSHQEVEKALLKRASLFGVSAIVLTILIITQLNLKLFFGDLEQHKQEIRTLSIIWFIGNALRLYLVGSALYYTLKLYVSRQSEACKNVQ
jgi:small-conductance mechanosensitive channel